MGIRINAFAVDAGAFDALLDRPLWKILVDLAATPPGDDVLFNVYQSGVEQRYAVGPDRRILRMRREGKGPSWQPVGERELAADEYLRRSLSVHLLSGDASTYTLSFLLRGLQTVDGVPYAVTVTHGYKTYWIESLQQAAQRMWYSTPPYQELSGFLSRFLRGDRRGGEPARQATPFPVVPRNDEDYPMAVLNPAECRRFVELLDLLIGCQPQFRAPTRLEDESDDGWDRWTREMIERYRAIRTFPLVNPHLVSFIG